MISISQTGCRKNDLLKSTEDGNRAGVRDFFSNNVGASSQVLRVMNELEKQNKSSGNSFIKNITGKHGYARWDKAFTQIRKPNYATSFSKMTGGSVDTVVIVPLVKDGNNQVEAYLEAHLTDEVKINLQTAAAYKRLPYSDLKSETNYAERVALRFMLLTQDVFDSSRFEILDKRLFHASPDFTDTATKEVKIQLKEKSESLLAFVDVCYYKVTFHTQTLSCGTIIKTIESQELICTSFLFDDTEGGNTGGTGSNGGGGTGTGGSGDPCSGGGLITNGVLPPDPCDVGDDPGWIPEVLVRDENGYLYSRIVELQGILAVNPEALEPCDNLNIMPLETYGEMWRNVAQYTAPIYVKNRIDSIRNILPGWIVDDYNIQSLTEAFGGIVNCDYFPVRITQMPTGYTPKSLLE